MSEIYPKKESKSQACKHIKKPKKPNSEIDYDNLDIIIIDEQYKKSNNNK